MNKLCKYIVALMFVLVFTAGCSRQAAPPDTVIIEQIPPLDSESTGQTTQLNPVSTEEAPYHIAIVTWPQYLFEETETMHRSAQALVAEFGAVADGGMIQHVSLPDDFEEDVETVISMTAGLAGDPLMKAIIISQPIPAEGTTAAFRKIKDSGRDDIFFIASTPHDELSDIYELADIVVDWGDDLRGYYDILRAKNMGAETFVFITNQRHMGIGYIARRIVICEEACEDLGIEFVLEAVPDPREAGRDIAQQAVYDMIPDLVKKYGKDTVFFGTHSAYATPAIQRALELGAIFVTTDDVTPFNGFPEALGLDLDALGDDFPAIVAKIEEAIIAKGGSGRIGCFPYAVDYCSGLGLARLAMDMIEGRGTGDTRKDIEAAFQATTSGCAWLARIYEGQDIGEKADNYYLVSMDTYIFGQGYSHVFSEPFPEKYKNIK